MQKRIEMRGVTCRNKEGLKVLKDFIYHTGEILDAGISEVGRKNFRVCVGLQPIDGRVVRSLLSHRRKMKNLRYEGGD